MKSIKTLIATMLVMLPVVAWAQFSQLGAKNQFMLKLEGGYMPFASNTGITEEKDFAIDSYHNAINFNAMAGMNLSQDWFVGAGAGFMYFHSTGQKPTEPYMGVTFFADFDFRPIWKGVMGLDYQPVTIQWAPELGGRIGGNMLLNHPDFGSPFSPMFEVYAGINWYYAHGLRNMGLNWHSFYATVGLAYMQQAFMVPVRVGWRW